MSEQPWAVAQAALREAGGDALLVTRAQPASAIGGHRRIGLHQSDAPFPSVFLPVDGPPHVCTPDPDGAMHLPADHVHPVRFDRAAVVADLVTWIGADPTVLYVDVCAPSTFQLLGDAFPGVELRDAAPILKLAVGAIHAPIVAPRPVVPTQVLAERRDRVRIAADALGVTDWYFLTPEAARFVGEGERHGFTNLPARGRVAVDRLSVGRLDELQRHHPNVTTVDATALLSRAAVPRSDVELAILRDGYARTEAAVEKTLLRIEVGMTEIDAQACFKDSAREVGLTADHIDHVWRVLPTSRDGVPWLRGEWAGQAPWSQLATDHVLAPGDHLAIDAGFTHEGYMTDFGWTFVVGRDVSDTEHELGRQWTEIADRVTAACRPGATAADLRAAALDGWTGNGNPWPFGLYVAHGLGYGGVAAPFAGTDLGPDAESAMTLQPGQVLMIEPYVFEDGVGGFRSERCVCITDDGVETWTTLPVEDFLRVG